MGCSCRWRSHLSSLRRRILPLQEQNGGSISTSRVLTPPIEKTFWFQASIFNLTPRRWRRTIRAHSLLEEQTMEIGIEFVLYIVELARLLVAFFKKFRMSREIQAKSWARTVRPVVNSTLAKTSEDGFQEFNFCYRHIVHRWQRSTVTDGVV